MSASQKDFSAASTVSENDSQILRCLTIIDYSTEDHLCMTAHLKDHHGYLHLTVGHQKCREDEITSV
jgi:hypothetical protein